MRPNPFHPLRDLQIASHAARETARKLAGKRGVTAARRAAAVAHAAVLAEIARLSREGVFSPVYSETSDADYRAAMHDVTAACYPHVLRAGGGA